MLKYFIILFFMLIGFSKSYVFYVEKNYSSLKKIIKKTTQEIKLLKVEWIYLNQSSRLQYLAKELLPEWKMIEFEQFDSLKNNSK